MNVEKFKKEYYALHPVLYRVAFALLNNAADTEDILQDAYCKLWDMRTELPEILHPEAFCVRLIKNLCLDFLRSPRNRPPENEPAEWLHLIDEATPENELISKQHIQQIEAMINRLPGKQRIVLQMRGCGDCSFEEIEAATGESAVHVRVLLSRARTALKGMLREETFVPL